MTTPATMCEVCDTSEATRTYGGGAAAEFQLCAECYADAAGDMVCEGLIGHVCPNCGLGFEDAASLPVHVADGTCDEAARECKP